MGSSGLRQYGPWKEVTRAQARASEPDRVLTIVESDDGDEWVGCGGYHWVNVLSYFCSTQPLPLDLVVDSVWLDEAGQPVADHE